MYTKTRYYNQKYVISQIHKQTGLPSQEISVIVNALGNIIKNTVADSRNHIQIKLFPGLKISAGFITPEQSRSNLNMKKEACILSLKAAFSDYFRREIREMHCNAAINSKRKLDKNEK